MFKREDEIQKSDIAIKITKLPSKFIPYPKDIEVSYVPYRFGDIKRAGQVFDPKIVGQQKEIIEFVSKGIFVESESNKDFSILDLTLADFLYISILRKVSTFGTSKFILSFYCAKCRTILKKVLSWEELEFDEMEVPKLPVNVELENKNIVLKFKPLTVRQHVELLDSGDAEDVLKALYKELQNPEVISYSKFEALSAQDGRRVDYADTLLYHGLKDVKFTCDSCQHVNWVSVDDKETLIVPFRESQKSLEDSICFGDQIVYQSS